MQHPEPSKTAGDALLQYACPRCQAQLQVSTRLAGTRQTCPTCEQSIQLPGIPTSTPATGKKSATQEVTNIPASARLALTCPQCQKRAFARGSQLGKTITCENCLEDILVVATLAESPEPVSEPSPITAVESPPGQDLKGTSPGGSSATESTIKLTTDDLLPESAPPPSPPPVPPPLPLPSPPSQPVEETYELDHLDLENPEAVAEQLSRPPAEKEISLEGLTAGPADTRSTEQILQSLDPLGTSPRAAADQAKTTDSYRFSINCLLCGTRLNVSSDDIGSEVRCPDCHSHTTIREPRKEKRPSSKPRTAEKDLLVPGPPIEPAGSEGNQGKKQAQVFMEKAREEVESRQEQFTKTANRGWWMTILPSMIQADIAIRILMHSIIGFLAVLTLHYGSLMEQGILAILGLFLFATSFLFFLATGASFLVSVVTIIETRANGEHEVENWPSLILMDWISMVPYMGVSLFIAVIPLVVWIPLTQNLDPAIVLTVGNMLTLLLFAPVILSTLSAGTPAAVFSSRVMASIALRPSEWFKFSGFVLLLSPAMAGSMALLGGSGPWPILAGSVSFMVTSFFYLHVVGSLGFHISCYREGDRLDQLGEPDEEDE